MRMLPDIDEPMFTGKGKAVTTRTLTNEREETVPRFNQEKIS
jgi:hypothetical protein